MFLPQDCKTDLILLDVAPSYTTEVVTALTTVCPSAGTYSVAGKTYTVTESTTLTITDCPCTQTKPVPVVPTSAVPEAPHVVTTEVVETTTIDCSSGSVYTISGTPVSYASPTKVPVAITKTVVSTQPAVTVATPVTVVKPSTIVSTVVTPEVKTVVSTAPAQAPAGPSETTVAPAPTTYMTTQQVTNVQTSVIQITSVSQPSASPVSPVQGGCPAGQMPAPVSQIADGQPQAPVSCIAAPAAAPSAAAPPAAAPPAAAPYPSAGASSPVYSGVAQPSGTHTGAPATYTGAASIAKPAAGLFAGLAALVAFL